MKNLKKKEEHEFFTKLNRFWKEKYYKDLGKDNINIF